MSSWNLDAQTAQWHSGFQGGLIGNITEQ